MKRIGPLACATVMLLAAQSTQPAYAFADAVGHLLHGAGQLIAHIFKSAPKPAAPVAGAAANSAASAAIMQLKLATMTTTTRTAVATQATTIRTLSAGMSVSPQVIRFAKGAVATGSVVATAAALGFVSSGVAQIDQDFHSELGAAALAPTTPYFPLGCKNSRGEFYGVPSDTKKCLDGTEPLVAEKPANLSGIQRVP